MWALRAELLGVSPHLSEEVLRKVADKTDIFTEAVIFDILAANPDELKKEELFQYLENKENPLPTYMIGYFTPGCQGRNLSNGAREADEPVPQRNDPCCQ
ncbi:MAG: hypothetical protein IPH45_20660 [Bacteroidales bacterium]|nr:hypothetical protein [Bacteroidales bacterium]